MRGRGSGGPVGMGEEGRGGIVVWSRRCGEGSVGPRTGGFGAFGGVGWGAALQGTGGGAGAACTGVCRRVHPVSWQECCCASRGCSAGTSVGSRFVVPVAGCARLPAFGELEGVYPQCTVGRMLVCK